mgnify:CR=1 FL=1
MLQYLLFAVASLSGCSQGNVGEVYRVKEFYHNDRQYVVHIPNKGFEEKDVLIWSLFGRERITTSQHVDKRKTTYTGRRDPYNTEREENEDRYNLPNPVVHIELFDDNHNQIPEKMIYRNPYPFVLNWGSEDNTVGYVCIKGRVVEGSNNHQDIDPSKAFVLNHKTDQSFSVVCSDTSAFGLAQIMTTCYGFTGTNLFPGIKISTPEEGSDIPKFEDGSSLRDRAKSGFERSYPNQEAKMRVLEDTVNLMARQGCKTLNYIGGVETAVKD